MGYLIFAGGSHEFLRQCLPKTHEEFIEQTKTTLKDATDDQLLQLYRQLAYYNPEEFNKYKELVAMLRNNIQKGVRGILGQ